MCIYVSLSLCVSLCISMHIFLFIFAFHRVSLSSHYPGESTEIIRLSSSDYLLSDLQSFWSLWFAICPPCFIWPFLASSLLSLLSRLVASTCSTCCLHWLPLLAHQPSSAECLLDLMMPHALSGYLTIAIDAPYWARLFAVNLQLTTRSYNPLILISFRSSFDFDHVDILQSLPLSFVCLPFVCVHFTLSLALNAFIVSMHCSRTE